MQSPRSLVSVDGSPFRVPYGKLPVASWPRLIDLDVEGTIHGFDNVGFSFLLEEIYVSSIVFQVPRSLPEVSSSDVGRIDELISFLKVLFFPEIPD